MNESPSHTTQTKSSPHPLKLKEHVRTIGAEFRETEGPIRRLIIHKVVLNNFKSYGGVTTIGPFHKRFTSIVGPNGSGKSNVIDAMLFVFGFRAKQIRFDKLSELIHNSKYYLNKNNGKPLQSMKVSIHFIEILDHDPDADDYEVIEGSEMVISREVFSDNTSKYRLNGTVCTQKQISNALKSFGMDLYNNRFLILQGEVEQISQMKPKATKPDEEGLLEYLEDIIGTNQYLEQINQALEKYEELQEQYQIHFNRTMLTQNEIQDMLQGKEEAEEYLSKENLYHKYNYMLTKHELMDLQTDMDKLTDELNSIKGELKSHNEGISTVVDQKNEISNNLKKLETEINKFSAKHREYGEEFKKLCNRDEDLRMQLLHEVKKVEEKTKLIKTLTSKIPELEKQSKNKLEESDQLKKTIPKLEQELEKAEKEFDEVRKSLASETEELMQNLQLYEKNLAPVQEKYDKVKNELESIETNLQLIEKTTEEEETRKLTLETDFSSTQITLQANKDNLKDISEKINDSSQKLQRIMIDISSLENKIAETNTKLINTRVSYESKRNEAGQNKFHNTIHDFVRKLSKTNKGIYGKFGDLVRVEDKFEKSFLAICGPFLEFFVVESPEVGTRIFTQLRQNNLGKVSCIALSVISTNANTDSDQQYGKYGYLSKYVFPSQKDENYEKIVKCINYYTRDVLVVQNLDEADEVSRKTSKRVVTIEGEVIEKDGRITGGGLEKTLKKFKQSKKGPSSDQSDDINNIFNKIESYETELKALKERHSGLSMEKDKNELHLRELNFTLDATKRKISSDESYLKDLESSLKSLKSTIQNQDNENQIKQLKKSLRETQNRKESTYQELVKKKKEVDKCLNDLENVGGGSLTASKARVSACEKNLSKLRKEIEDSREQYAVLAGESQKYSRDLTRLDSDIQQHKTREKNLENQLDQLEEEASKINECLIEVNNKLNELKSTHSDLTESMKKMTVQIKEHDILVIDLRHKQEKCEKSLSLLKNTQKQKNEKMNESKKLFYNSLKSLKTSTRSTELYVTTMKLDTLSIHSNRCSKTGDDLVPKDSNLNHSESSELNGQTELNELNGINGSCEGKDLVKNEKVDDIEDLIEDVGVLNKKVQSLKVQLSTVPNLSIIDSFVEKVNDFSNKKKNLLDVQNQRDEAKLLHENLSFKRKSEFLFNFEIIANKLKEIYQMITLGGDAELELVDSTEPFTEGVLFSVRPVKKSWKQIYNLSGGEKTLSSLALVFALHHYKPNPVYFMDEIDAALDFRNVSIIAQSIKERTKDAQFIIISLRNQMFEMCNKMVGIYKTFDVTKSMAINPQTLANQYTEENSQS